MLSLGDFASVSNGLKTVKKSVVVAMHKFIYEDDGDRNNRKRLREFDGFDYDDKSECFKVKVAYVAEHLTTGDLTSICNVLGISYEVNDLFLHIFNNLRKGTMLKNIENEDDENDNLDDAEIKSDDEQRKVGIVRVPSNSSFVSATPTSHKKETKQSSNDTNYRMDNEDVNVRQDYSYSMQQFNNQAPKFTLNFRDIEESVRIFDGNGNLPVNVWVEEFEETSSIMGWDDFQKYIFAKRSLKGLAKLFIAGERNGNEQCTAA